MVIVILNQLHTIIFSIAYAFVCDKKKGGRRNSLQVTHSNVHGKHNDVNFESAQHCIQTLRLFGNIFQRIDYAEYGWYSNIKSSHEYSPLT